jgi:hypothetical protein
MNQSLVVFVVATLLLVIHFAEGQLITASQFRCMFPRVPQQRVNTWMPILNNGI